MDLDALKTEAAKPDYDKMSDAEIAAAINIKTVAGLTQDVVLGDVAGVFLQKHAFVPLQKFAQRAPSGDATHDAALQVAETFVAWIGLGSNAPIFRCSQPEIYAEAQQMLGALMAQEAAEKGSTGVTQEVNDAVIALAQTTVPLWQSLGSHRELDHGDIIQARGQNWGNFVTVDLAKPHEFNPKLVAAKQAAYDKALADATAKNDPAAAKLAQAAADAVVTA